MKGSSFLQMGAPQTGPDLAGIFASAGGAVSFLGPAEVTALGPDSATVLLATGTTERAFFAFALPYEPSLGDVLLVIGGPGATYAIGVLAGRGRLSIAFPGDVDVRAVGGKLRLGGDGGVEISGKGLEVMVDKVKITAGEIVERCASLYQRVTSLFSAHHKQAHTVVDDESHTRARRATVLTEETVTINGKQIHLG
ncbi:DUF3540 domain-containing protein [Sorangium sp. So ce590]|uniref:DUF3540 domain-containing protein n=1 Tax=unclassified Sorangium TaxID=2621164 RepID=UPI003F63F1A3